MTNLFIHLKENPYHENCWQKPFCKPFYVKQFHRITLSLSITPKSNNWVSWQNHHGQSYKRDKQTTNDVSKVSGKFKL